MKSSTASRPAGAKGNRLNDTARKAERRPKGCAYWRNLLAFAFGMLILGSAFVFYGVLPVLYAFRRAHPDRIPVCCTDPADYGLAYEDVSIESADGAVLRGWYIRSRNGAAVVLAHGIGGNRMAVLEQGAFLAQEGYGALLLDLRAHGESGGDAVTFGGEDIRAAVEWLESQPDVGGKIGAAGYSLGGLQALQAAAGMPRIAAVLADGAAPNVFADTPAPDRVPRWLDLPFQWVTFQVWAVLGVTGPMPLTEAIQKISPRPILLIAGGASDYETAMQAGFLRAAGEGGSLWEIPGAGHNGGWALQTEEYKRRMAGFFNQALLHQSGAIN